VGNNIETIVNIINQIGISEIKFSSELNDFILDENIGVNKINAQTDSMIDELNELLISQVDLKVDYKMFQNLLTIVDLNINNLKLNYNNIRVFYDYESIPSKAKSILKIIDFKISKLQDLKLKFKLNGEFSAYLGQTEKNKITITEDKSAKYKVSTRFELLKELGIENIITSLKCSQKEKHKILSIIMDIHTDTAKGLINKNYKWSGSDGEKKIIDDILKNIK
jgi:hypothetical protein